MSCYYLDEQCIATAGSVVRCAQTRNYCFSFRNTYTVPITLKVGIEKGEYKLNLFSYCGMRQNIQYWISRSLQAHVCPSACCCLAIMYPDN